MQEDLLHYIWKMKRFDWRALQTTEGERVEILDFGAHNHGAGPDFSEAKIKLGSTIWVGNIEMHVHSSDWYKHKHQHDPRYDNIILHVVYKDDRPVIDSRQNLIPTIELRDRLDNRILDSYQLLMESQHWILCAKSIGQVNDFTKSSWLDRLLIERLERKTKLVQESLSHLKHDWEEAFYRSICKSFGLKANVVPFELLAQSMTFRTLLRYKDNSLYIEALLFGQSGLLNPSFEDEFPNKLKTTYQHLQYKHHLKPIDPILWKFMRMRPANFPTIRIAQLAQLIFQSNHIFSKVLAANSVQEIENMFDVKLSNYWKSHYRFDQASSAKPKRIGRSTIHLIMINTIVPFLFSYGKFKKEDKYIDKSLQLLKACKSESNTIIRNWEKHHMTSENAFASQALLELKNEYCKPKKCMDCAIGNAIMKN